MEYTLTASVSAARVLRTAGRSLTRGPQNPRVYLQQSVPRVWSMKNGTLSYLSRWAGARCRTSSSKALKAKIAEAAAEEAEKCDGCHHRGHNASITPLSVLLWLCPENMWSSWGESCSSSALGCLLWRREARLL